MQSNDEQRVLWNGRAGEAWVAGQTLLDTMFAPFADALVGAVAQAKATRVLDVGCGTGSTTLAISRLPEVRCVGADVSRPMLALARRRAADSRASFLEADAQSHVFAPYDMLVSRFGVMFFGDPPRAFANLRASATSGAQLHVIAWRGAAENPFMTAAEQAAAPLLPQLTKRLPNAPGQFAFADPERVRRILHEGGWSAIDLQPLDVVCTFPERELVSYVTRHGPLGLLLPELDEATRARVIEVVLAAFAPFVHGDEVRYTAACWTVRARNAKR
jgi:SAM-dependent methyltransferase